MYENGCCLLFDELHTFYPLTSGIPNDVGALAEGGHVNCCCLRPIGREDGGEEIMNL